MTRRAGCMGLEADPNLALERSASVFARDLTKRGVRVHVEAGLVRSRVVEYVCRVDTKRKALGFTDTELLADVRIESIVADLTHRVLPERSSSARLRVLQNNHAGSGPSDIDRVRRLIRGRGVLNRDSVGHRHGSRRTGRNNVGKSSQGTTGSRSAVEIV